jgi:hypothetical protein
LSLPSFLFSLLFLSSLLPSSLTHYSFRPYLLQRGWCTAGLWQTFHQQARPIGSWHHQHSTR